MFFYIYKSAVAINICSMSFLQLREARMSINGGWARICFPVTPKPCAHPYTTRGHCISKYSKTNPQWDKDKDKDKPLNCVLIHTPPGDTEAASIQRQRQTLSETNTYCSAIPCSKTPKQYIQLQNQTSQSSEKKESIFGAGLDRFLASLEDQGGWWNWLGLGWSRQDPTPKSNCNWT